MVVIDRWPSQRETSEIGTAAARSHPGITTCDRCPLPVNVSFVIYQDPLAYLLGLEGIALLDAWAGDYDREFTDARLAEIRQLLDDEKLRDREVLAERVSTVIAYEQQSAGYDAEAGGGLFAADEPLVAEYLSGREPGVALDAACGTGRFAEFLAGRGHRVIGVDSSPDMLAHARRRVLHDLPARLGHGSLRTPMGKANHLTRTMRQVSASLFRLCSARRRSAAPNNANQCTLKVQRSGMIADSAADSKSERTHPSGCDVSGAVLTP